MAQDRLGQSWPKTGSVNHASKVQTRRGVVKRRRKRRKSSDHVVRTTVQCPPGQIHRPNPDSSGSALVEISRRSVFTSAAPEAPPPTSRRARSAVSQRKNHGRQGAVECTSVETRCSMLADADVRDSSPLSRASRDVGRSSGRGPGAGRVADVLAAGGHVVRRVHGHGRHLRPQRDRLPPHGARHLRRRQQGTPPPPLARRRPRRGHAR